MDTKLDMVVISKGLEWQEHMNTGHFGQAGIHHGNNKNKNRQHMLWWKRNVIDVSITLLRAEV